MPDTSPDGGRAPRGPLAVIDVGTNSARLLVATMRPPDGWKLVHEERIACRLGAGLAETGEINAAAEARTGDAIARLLRSARAAGCVEVRVVGTHALRAAHNAVACKARLERRVGTRIQILSGEQEAALALRVARRWLPLTRELIALDLGGGSLEIAAHCGETNTIVSLALGAVLISQTLPADVVPPATLASLAAQVRSQLQRDAADFAACKAPVAAAGGTATSAARLSGFAAPLSGVWLERQTIERLAAEMARLDRTQRALVPGVGDRADIIVPGLVVLGSALAFLGAERFCVLEHGVREGALLALAAGEL